MRKNTCKPLILLFSLSFRVKLGQGKEFQRPYNLIKKTSNIGNKGIVSSNGLMKVKTHYKHPKVAKQ